jgi:ABC-type glycerol-3-phosphate transport system permease component
VDVEESLVIEDRPSVFGGCGVTTWWTLRIRTLERRLSTTTVYLILWIGAAGLVFPIYWMIASSVKPMSELFSTGTHLWPSHVTWEHYKFALQNAPIGRGLWNSLIIAVSRAVGGTFLAAMAGFAFAKHQFPGRDVLFGLTVGTLMVPPEIGMIPLFAIMSILGWVNTYQAVILPYLVTPWGIFFMRQYILGIPDSLLDSARIDGAGEWQIFAKIILPLIRPAAAGLAIMTFVSAWNEFLWPLIVLRSPEMYTALLVVNSMPSIQFATPWGAVMAASTLSVLPALVTFILLGRFFSPVLPGAERE